MYLKFGQTDARLLQTPDRRKPPGLRPRSQFPVHNQYRVHLVIEYLHTCFNDMLLM